MAGFRVQLTLPPNYWAEGARTSADWWRQRELPTQSRQSLPL